MDSYCLLLPALLRSVVNMTPRTISSSAAGGSKFTQAEPVWARPEDSLASGLADSVGAGVSVASGSGPGASSVSPGLGEAVPVGEGSEDSAGSLGVGESTSAGSSPGSGPSGSGVRVSSGEGSSNPGASGSDPGTHFTTSPDPGIGAEP